MAQTPGSQPSAAMPVYQSPDGGGYVNTSLFIGTTTVVKASPGSVIRMNVLVAGSGTGTINDCTASADVATGNEVAVIPQTVGTVELSFPCKVGITVVPGAGQRVSLSYE